MRCVCNIPTNLDKKYPTMKYKFIDTRKEKVDLPWSMQEEFAAHAKKVGQFFKRYTKPVTLEIHLSGSKKAGYHLAYSVKLKDGSVVYASGKSHELLALPNEVFRSFLKALKKERAIERKEHLVNKAKRMKEAMIKSRSALQEMSGKGQREEFAFLIGQLLDPVKHYMRRRIKVFEVKGLIPEGALKLDEVFESYKTRLFEQYPTMIASNVSPEIWAYRLADEELEKALKARAWDGTDKRVSIEELTAKEIKEMEEEFSTDGDGDLVMLEELDDISYHLDDYITEDIELGVNEEEKLLEQLEAESPDVPAEQSFHRKTSAMLASMPLQESSIFDLYVHSRLSVEEIALVKNIPADEVQKTLDNVRQQLRQGFRKMYLQKPQTAQ